MSIFAESIQDLLIDNKFVQLIPKLLHIEFAELQYNTGQIVYNLINHGTLTYITKIPYDSYVPHIFFLFRR